MRHPFTVQDPPDSARILLTLVAVAVAVIVAVLVVVAVRPAMAAAAPSIEEQVADTCAHGCVLMPRADYEAMRARATLPCARI